MFKNIRFYVNVNKLIFMAAGVVCFAIYLRYCKKTGKDPVGPIVTVMSAR